MRSKADESFVIVDACKELFTHFRSQYPVDVFKSINFSNLPQIEDLFKINIVIY